MCMSEAPGHPGFAAGKNFHDLSFFHFASYFKQKIKSTINQNAKLQLWISTNLQEWTMLARKAFSFFIVN